MPVIGGWSMPEADKYFKKFIPENGPLPKINGFQRDHLLAAFGYVRSWRMALDIGAHVGFWTRDMAERFEQVYAFEAAPDTFACLKDNTSELANVTRYNVAIGDENGRCNVCYDPKRELAGNTGSRYVRPTVNGGRVKMLTIDSLHLSECDFIKIDVEGFEYRVLLGAKETIMAYSPTIIMECDKYFSGRYEDGSGLSEEFLIANKYVEVAHMRPNKVFVRK